MSATMPEEQAVEMVCGETVRRARRARSWVKEARVGAGSLAGCWCWRIQAISASMSPLVVASMRGVLGEGAICCREEARASRRAERVGGCQSVCGTLWSQAFQRVDRASGDSGGAARVGVWR